MIEGWSATIAVVGMGPRGLGALEALAARLLVRGRSLTVDLYDPFPAAGAGPNFDPAESPLCLLNIPHRDISIRPPEFSRVGAFAEWLDHAPDPDRFPQRAELGRYLESRHADLAGTGALKIHRRNTRVTDLRKGDGTWVLTTEQGEVSNYGDVLLTLGQPPTRPDEQLSGWQDHVLGSEAILASAYPAAQLQGMAQNWAGRTVAIRGLALSAFDVLRVLTAGQGGRFDENGNDYRPSGREPARIVPFSLDGKPPYPKPRTGEWDDRFGPTGAETATFTAALDEAVNADPGRAEACLNGALVPVVHRILGDTGSNARKSRIRDWIETEWDAPGDQESGDAATILAHGIRLAEGAEPPSIGYAVGQVWRKWQNELRRGFNTADHSPDTARAILKFDEGLKRYSYGPPLEAARELSALAEAGIVDLDHAADPEIELIDKGWRLKTAGKAVEASVMIDAVLPSPDLEAIDAPLIEGLRAPGMLCARGEGLAARTAADGTLIDASGDRVEGLCLLGRLALGSVIAADSLHDCFGASADRWADGVLARHS